MEIPIWLLILVFFGITIVGFRWWAQKEEEARKKKLKAKRRSQMSPSSKSPGDSASKRPAIHPKETKAQEDFRLKSEKVRNQIKTAQLKALKEKLEAAEKQNIPVSKIKEGLGQKTIMPQDKGSWSPDEIDLESSLPIENKKPYSVVPLDLEKENQNPSEKGMEFMEDFLIPSEDKVLPEIEVVESFNSESHFKHEQDSDRFKLKTKGTLLVVDDSKSIRTILEKLLKSYGYDVVCAVDGEDALKLLEQFKNPPLVMITDIEMPKMDGFALIRKVRAMDHLEGLPIIAMTSHLNLHLEIAAEEEVNGFLPKPFNNQDLIDQLTFLIEN